MRKTDFLFILFFLILISCAEENPAERQVQLEQEQQTLDFQRQNLEALKNQQTQQSQQTGTLPLQISSYNNRIQNFLEILQSLKAAEDDVNRTAAAEMSLQNSFSQLARDQLEPRIRQLENDIIQTKQQIGVWTNQTFNLNADQRQLLANLQNTLSFQQQQLDLLNAERVNLSSQILSNSMLLNSASLEQKRQIAEEQNSIQNEIFTLRGEIERLQNVYAQTRMSLVPLAQQIAQAQAAYDEQQKKVRALEESIRPP